jgi:hypothetical protein
MKTLKTLKSRVPLDGCVVEVHTQDIAVPSPWRTLSVRYIQQRDCLEFMECCYSYLSVEGMHASATDPQSCARAVMRWQLHDMT